MVYEFGEDETAGIKFTYAHSPIKKNSQYYSYNAHGDVVQLVEDGEVVRNYEYDAFGNELNPDSNDTNPFRYCGEYFDKESGTMYLRARYYNPIIGRFSTVDPARDGLNWYAYCGNSPVVLVDPNGTDSQLDDWVNTMYPGQVTVTIVVTVPIENSNQAVEVTHGMNGTGIDVGHTFIRIGYEDGRTEYYGFYPKNGLNDENITDLIGPIDGEIRTDDGNKQWNIAKTYVITKEQALQISRFSSSYNQKYDLRNNNCTSFAVQALEIVGISSPTWKHKWVISLSDIEYAQKEYGKFATNFIRNMSGFSPANAAIDITAAPGYYARNTHGVVTFRFVDPRR